MDPGRYTVLLAGVCRGFKPAQNLIFPPFVQLQTQLVFLRLRVCYVPNEKVSRIQHKFSLLVEKGYFLGPKIMYTIKKISATHVIKLGFAPNSYPPGQPMLSS